MSQSKYGIVSYTEGPMLAEPCTGIHGGTECVRRSGVRTHVQSASVRRTCAHTELHYLPSRLQSCKRVRMKSVASKV